MKKLYTLAFSLLLAYSGKTQFAITAEDAPEIGDRYVTRSADTTGVQPGSAGNGITWNFSNLVPLNDSLVENFVSPSSTPYAADYPSANQATGDSEGNYNYFQLSTDGYYYHGAVVNTDNGPVKYKYTDPAKYYKFPYNYGDTYTDNLAGNFSSNGLTFNRTGTFTGSYDGFGTLVLPGGTYANTARIKLVENNTDVASIGGFTVTVKTDITTYIWRQDGDDEALLTISLISTQSAGGTTLTKVVRYSDDGTSSISEIQAFAITARPNPANGTATVFSEKNLSEISILNLSGQEVLRREVQSRQVDLDLSGIAPGLYLLRAVQEDGTVGTGKLVVQ